MFEVGKKYHYYPNKNHTYECVFVGRECAMLRNIVNGSEFAAALKNFPNYPECKEPKIEKFVRHLRQYREETVSLHTKSVPAHYECTTQLGQIEFTLTDGKLTDVKILEN